MKVMLEGNVCYCGVEGLVELRGHSVCVVACVHGRHWGVGSVQIAFPKKAHCSIMDCLMKKLLYVEHRPNLPDIL